MLVIYYCPCHLESSLTLVDHFSVAVCQSIHLSDHLSVWPSHFHSIVHNRSVCRWHMCAMRNSCSLDLCEKLFYAFTFVCSIYVNFLSFFFLTLKIYWRVNQTHFCTRISWLLKNMDARKKFNNHESYWNSVSKCYLWLEFSYSKSYETVM